MFSAEVGAGDSAGGLVEAAEQGRVEQDVPEAIVDLLEGDVLAVERLAEEDLTGSEAKAARIRDPSNFAVTRVLGTGDALRERPRRGHPDRARRGVIERLMRALVVEAAAENVEASLLRGMVRSGWPSGVSLQRAMHAFVRAVLLRTAGEDALMRDAQLHPPGVELAQAVDAGRGSRDDLDWLMDAVWTLRHPTKGLVAMFAEGVDLPTSEVTTPLEFAAAGSVCSLGVGYCDGAVTQGEVRVSLDDATVDVGTELESLTVPDGTEWRLRAFAEHHEGEWCGARGTYWNYRVSAVAPG